VKLLLFIPDVESEQLARTWLEIVELPFGHFAFLASGLSTAHGIILVQTARESEHPHDELRTNPLMQPTSL